MEAEREKREKILYLSFLCADDFCQKFVRAIFFVQKSNVKREEEEENLMSFSKLREKRDLKFVFRLNYSP